MEKNKKILLPIVLALCLLVTGQVACSIAKYIWSQSATITLAASCTKTPPTPTIPEDAPVLTANTFKNLDKQQANHIRFIDLSANEDTVTYQTGKNGNLAYITHINGNKVIPAGKKDDYPATAAGEGIYYYTNDEKFSSGSKECNIFQCPSCSNTIGKKDIGYFVSSGPIYLPEDCTQLFSGISNVSDCNAHVIDFTNVNTSCVKNMSRMFEQCKVYRINMVAFTMESLTNISDMFKNCSNLTTVQVSAMNGMDRSSGFEPGKYTDGSIILGTDTFKGTKLTNKGGGEYAKVSSGNFTAASRMVYAAEPTPDYILNTDDVTDMTFTETLTEEGLELQLTPNDSYILPECIFVTIGDSDYFIYTTEDGPENPEGITFAPGESILFITKSLLPIDGSEIILSANAEEAPVESEVLAPNYILNIGNVTNMMLTETVTEEGLQLQLTPNEGFQLPECVFLTIGDKDYFVYTTEDGPENPEGITFDPGTSILFIDKSLLPIDGSEIILSADAVEVSEETEPAEETTEPTEEPIEPAETATEPTEEEPAEPAEAVTESTEEPTEAPAELTATVPPTEAPTTEPVQDME